MRTAAVFNYLVGRCYVIALIAVSFAVSWAGCVAQMKGETFHLRGDAGLQIHLEPKTCLSFPCLAHVAAYYPGDQIIGRREWICPLAIWGWGDGTSSEEGGSDGPCALDEPQTVWPYVGDYIGDDLTEFKTHVYRSPGSYEISFTILSVPGRKLLARQTVVVTVPRKGE